MSSLLRMLTPSSPMGRSRHSTIDDDDEEVDASSHTPLLGHDPTGPHTRTTPRMITADGALIIVYPCRSSPPLFSFALPAALDDIVPSPQYRAHVAELNALMLVTDDEKRRRRNAAAALGAIVTITCLGAVGWLGIAQRHYWLAFWWMVLAILFMLLQLALAAFCMANLEHAMQLQVNRMLSEWNARAPKNVRFQILNASSAATFPWLSASTIHLSSPESQSRTNSPSSAATAAAAAMQTPSLAALAAAAHEPQLLIELLDPGRGDGEQQPHDPFSEVYITPECDGAMMAVKIIPRSG